LLQDLNNSITFALEKSGTENLEKLALRPVNSKINKIISFFISSFIQFYKNKNV